MADIIPLFSETMKLDAETSLIGVIISSAALNSIPLDTIVRMRVEAEDGEMITAYEAIVKAIRTLADLVWDMDDYYKMKAAFDGKHSV